MSHGFCYYENSSRLFGALILVVSCSAVVLAITQAYQARTISDELSESAYIGIAMFGLLQALIIGIPVAFLVGENSTASFFVKAGLIFLISMSILLLMFVPKISQAKSNDGQVDTGGSSTLADNKRRWLSGGGSCDFSRDFLDDGLRFRSTADEYPAKCENALQEKIDTLEEENVKLLLENLNLKKALHNQVESKCPARTTDHAENDEDNEG